MLRNQEKQISQITEEGSKLVYQMEKVLCSALQIRGLKAVRIESKQKKADGIMKRLIGGDKQNKNTSLSLEQQLILQ
jgi:hypothetical protein